MELLLKLLNSGTIVLVCCNCWRNAMLRTEHLQWKKWQHFMASNHCLEPQKLALLFCDQPLRMKDQQEGEEKVTCEESR